MNREPEIASNAKFELKKISEIDSHFTVTLYLNIETYGLAEPLTNFYPHLCLGGKRKWEMRNVKKRHLLQKSSNGRRSSEKVSINSDKGIRRGKWTLSSPQKVVIKIVTS